MTGVPGFLQRHRTGLTFAALVLFCLLSISISNRNVVLKPKEVGQSFFSLFQVAFNGVADWLSGTWSALGRSTSGLPGTCRRCAGRTRSCAPSWATPSR
jgi:hypothetical protein